MNHPQGFCSKRSVPDSLPRQYNQHHHLGVLGQVKEFHVYQNKLAKKMHWCMCILILILSVQIPFADAKISFWRKCKTRTMWVQLRKGNKDKCDILKNICSRTPSKCAIHKIKTEISSGRVEMCDLIRTLTLCKNRKMSYNEKKNFSDLCIDSDCRCSDNYKTLRHYYEALNCENSDNRDKAFYEKINIVCGVFLFCLAGVCCFAAGCEKRSGESNEDQRSPRTPRTPRTPRSPPIPRPILRYDRSPLHPRRPRPPAPSTIVEQLERNNSHATDPASVRSMLGPGNEESIHEQNDNATNSARETIETREDPPAYEDPPSFHDAVNAMHLNQLNRNRITRSTQI